MIQFFRVCLVVSTHIFARIMIWQAQKSHRREKASHWPDALKWYCCWCWWCWRVGPSVVRVYVCVCRMSFQLEIAFFNFLNVMWCMIRFTMHYVYMLGKRVQPEIDRYCSALHIFPLAKQLQFSSKTWQCLQFEKIMCAHTRILNVKNWCRCCRRFSWIFMAIIRSKAKLTGLRAKPFPVSR